MSCVRREAQKPPGLGNQMRELKIFLDMWAFMKILFPKDLGKNFKLKYRRWLCVVLKKKNVSVCMSQLESSGFAATCQPAGPS